MNSGNSSGNVYGPCGPPTPHRPTPGEKGPQMRRSFRSTRRLVAVGVVAGLAVLALIGTASAPAATTGSASLTAAHKCLVMTGSGDPAFVKNFNPYTATGLPSAPSVQAAFYEPLVVVGEGGLKPVRGSRSRGPGAT